MLSNPTNNLHNRQRQHRRQNSTPTAFESVKVSNLPNIQRNGAHRRGMSLDQRRRQTPPQEKMVSKTNTGYLTTQQHILRETQQQRLVRPGQGQQQYTTFDNDENYLDSPAVTPNRQSFDTGCANEYQKNGQNSGYSYSGPNNMTMNVNPNGADDFNLFSGEPVLTASAFLDFSNAFDNSNQGSENSSRRGSGRRISDGIVDRVSQFEQLGLKSPHRPVTPPNHDSHGYFPPTPGPTPHHRIVKHEHVNQRFHEAYDTSMEATIKSRINQRARGVFDDMRKATEMQSMPSPPQSSEMPSSNTFDSAPMPSGNFMDIPHVDLEFEGSQYSPVSSQLSPTLSYSSSPEISQMAMFGDPFSNKPTLEAPSASYPEPSAHSLSIPSSPVASSPYRRSESISSMNAEEQIADTGITIDDIATFISGPENDGKWVCLYPECNKRFGRKENIKSHVQTHLGDRQFQCTHCSKCFVRQHDLKRHSKIHSGVKPYPCQCGNSFARHDALTRHRQRGMCIGAFEGVVKKTVKRGRPPKNRPDHEKRLEKSNRTRSKNKARSTASSTTGFSESNEGTSPRSDLDDILDDKPFGDYEHSQTSSAMLSDSYPYSQESIPVDYVTPEAMQAHSPSALSTHSQLSSASRHNSISESFHLPSHPASPAKSVHSYHSPPGLCESSSPAASIYYDLDDINQGDDMGKLSLSNISEHEDEMFLEAFSTANSAEMTALERDPSLLKFDDGFANTGDDFFNTDQDVFFGSP